MLWINDMSMTDQDAIALSESLVATNTQLPLLNTMGMSNETSDQDQYNKFSPLGLRAIVKIWDCAPNLSFIGMFRSVDNGDEESMGIIEAARQGNSKRNINV